MTFTANETYDNKGQIIPVNFCWVQLPAAVNVCFVSCFLDTQNTGFITELLSREMTTSFHIIDTTKVMLVKEQKSFHHRLVIPAVQHLYTAYGTSRSFSSRVNDTRSLILHLKKFIFSSDEPVLDCPLN